MRSPKRGALGPDERRLARRVAVAQRWLTAIYRLDLQLEPTRYVVSQADARKLLPSGGPRSGVLACEEDGALWLGLYVDPRDVGDPGTIVEETSHLVCLAWHAAHGRRISRLVLELQAEIDRYAVARLAGGDGLRHLRDAHWAPELDPPTLERYATAHRVARRYCLWLARRFPARADVPELLAELRDFYRAPGEEKLRARRGI